MYCQAGGYLLATGDTTDVIDKDKDETMNFKQPEHRSMVRCLEVLWEHALRCDR